jgi:hypothetical protein
VLSKGAANAASQLDNQREGPEMNHTTRLTILASAAILSLAVSAGAQAQQASMNFFVTSAGGGKGADLGGLPGADAHCQQLAQAAGAGAKTWHAYLSTQAADGKPAVNARDRIGAGPWQNAKGVVVAKNLDELHSQSNNLTKQTALTEKGDVVNGRGDTPNEHDALTGSTMDGHAFPSGDDRTCKNWTRHPGDRHARPHRPTGAPGHRRGKVVEFVAPVARHRGWLQPGRSQEHRRRRQVLLLRNELIERNNAIRTDGRAFSPQAGRRSVSSVCPGAESEGSDNESRRPGRIRDRSSRH